MKPLRAADWTNRFAALGTKFFTQLPAQGLPDPHWVATSPACAELLGWPADWTARDNALAVFSGNTTWPGMQPLATVYSGHQFGVWAGQFGSLPTTHPNAPPRPSRSSRCCARCRCSRPTWSRWRARTAPDAETLMLAVNPAVVLRNHLAEGAIRAADQGDFSETERLLKVLSRPFDEPVLPSDAALPPDWAQTLEMSCSS